MSKGNVKKESVWERCVKDLQKQETIFRMDKRNDSRVIRIREFRDGKCVNKFSSQGYHWRNEQGLTTAQEEKEIVSCYKLCLQADEDGSWVAAGGALAVEEIKDWPSFAAKGWEYIDSHILIWGSKKSAHGHLTGKSGIDKLTGPVCAGALEKWALKKLEEDKPGEFNNRITTLQRLNEIEIIELDDVIKRLNKKKVSKKSARGKDQARQHEKPRAIPTDNELFNWLKSIDDPMLQWAFAMQATYGLRTSEVWHVLEIDEDGWLHVGPMTKTGERLAYPCPIVWVEEFELRTNLKRFLKQLDSGDHQRQIVKRGRLNKCINNDDLGNWLWRRINCEIVPRLWAAAEDSESKTARDTQLGRVEDYCRPYDFRHAFAIRCFTNPEVFMESDEEHARWMGHGVLVHTRIYRKWMPMQRQKEAVKARRQQNMDKEPQERPVDADLPDDVMEKLAKLEQLEKLMAS